MEEQDLASKSQIVMMKHSETCFAFELKLAFYCSKKCWCRKVIEIVSKKSTKWSLKMNLWC